MDCVKMGKLISSLRLEKGLTQKMLADKMNISDKTVSKWERGLGCPDVSLLNEVSEILGVNIEKILTGEITPNRKDGGNVRNLKFYFCSDCGSFLTASGKQDISCCGRKLSALVPQKADEQHKLSVNVVEDDYYITFTHEMSKEHFITLMAQVSYDKVLYVKLYPEQGGEVRFHKLPHSKIFYICNKDGLWISDMN